jgi:hypothetical protein
MQTEMYAEMTEEEIDTAIDVIYARIDSLLDDAQFWEVNDILDSLDLDQPTVILIAYLSITLAAKPELGWRRANCVARVRRVLTERDPARVEKLLLGLE